MSFFLLVRRDESIELLSSQLFATRQDALAFLAELTSGVDFDAWDDEVLVADSDVAAPVLLVRPTAAPVTTEAAEPVSELESAFVVEADEPTYTHDESTLPAAVEPPAVAADPEPAPEPLAPVEDAWAEAIAETIDADDDDLRAALSRTTEAMAAEGIPVIESVDALESSRAEAGSPLSSVAAEPMSQIEHTLSPPTPLIVEETASEPPPVEEPVTSWPWDGPAPQPPVADDRIAAEPESLGATTPDEAEESSAAPASDVDTEPEAEAHPAEPVESTVEDDSAGSTDFDAESEALSSPEPAGLVDPQPVVELQPAVDPQPIVEAPVDPEVSLGETAEPESDFILDLDDPPAAPAPPGYSAPTKSDVDISGMTCDDCVYVSTCPNKDERDPSSCGSFQWK